MKYASRIPIDNAIAQCESHLNETKSWGTDIESYLTKFLIIFTCGVFESEVKRIVNLRSQSTGDPQVAAFVTDIVEDRDWVKLGELRGEILGRFSDTYKAKFKAKTDGTIAAQYYENIVQNRMSSAHGGPINITFKELKTTYKKADTILTKLANTLQVKR